MWIMSHATETAVSTNYHVSLTLNRLDFIDNKFKII